MENPLKPGRRRGQSPEVAQETLVESGVAPQGATGRPPLPGRYEDLGLLASGAFGEVRRVRDTFLDRVLAMKVLRPEHAERAGVRQRFLTEARITAQLQHPGIVAIHERGELADGRLWFTMKEVRGRTLREVIGELHAASGPEGFGALPSGWTFRRLVEALVRLAQAIAYAHSRGVVHRDIKPDNLMVGEFGEVLVMDWGLARLALDPAENREESGHGETDSSELTRHGDVLGTPAYMPPEQARGETDRHGPESDVYALGAVLHHLLSGRAPYAGSSHEVLLAIASGERPAPPTATRNGAPVPAELVAIAARSMHPDIASRTPGAEAFASDLVAWLDGVRKREQALAALSQARGLEPTFRKARADAEDARARARALWGDIRPCDPVDKKRPAWSLEDASASLRRDAALAETQWIQAVHGALSLDPELSEAHAALADHYMGALAEAERSHRDEDAARFEALLRAHDRGRHGAFLRGEGALSLVTEPEGARVIAERYASEDRRLVPHFFADLGRTPLREAALPHGSYLLRLQAEGRAEVLCPVKIERGEHGNSVAPGEEEPSPIALPKEGDLSPGEVYVPAGWCRVGGDPEAADSLPAARLWVDGFVIAEHPVTTQEYAAFLDDLLAQGRQSEMERVCPRSQMGLVEAGAANLAWQRQEDGRLVPPADWGPSTPVVLVDWHAASAYARWLAERTGRPYRLPNELEREKAARGVDGRLLPWGNHPDAAFACVLESHAGPPERVSVEAYPTDQSPYGVRGLGGNVREWCINRWRLDGPPVTGGRLLLDPAAEDDAGFRTIKGGMWSSPIVNSRAAARFGGKPDLCRLAVGFRVVRRFP